MPVTWLFQVKKFHVSWHFHQIPMFHLLLGFRTYENLVYVLWVWVTSVFLHSLYVQVLKKFKARAGLELRVYRCHHFWRNTQNPRGAIKLQLQIVYQEPHHNASASEGCARTQHTKSTKSLHSTCITKTDNFPFLLNWSVQSCLTLCDPMGCSTPGFPVHHQLLELTETHVHWVSVAIQPSHPLSSASPTAFNLPQHPTSQFFASCGQSTGVLASTSVLPMNIQDWSPLGWTGWISLQSKGLPRVYSSTTVQKHQFFSAQLSL